MKTSLQRIEWVADDGPVCSCDNPRSERREAQCTASLFHPKHTSPNKLLKPPTPDAIGVDLLANLHKHEVLYTDFYKPVMFEAVSWREYDRFSSTAVLYDITIKKAMQIT